MEISNQKVRFCIKGIAPLLFDRYHGLPDPKSADGYQKQAIEKLYLDDKKNICVPACAIKAAMRLAAAEVGQVKASGKNRQTIKAGVFFDRMLYSIGKKKPDEIRSDQVKRGTGTKLTTVTTYRPCVLEWEVEGEMNLFFVPTNFAKQALELAGFRFGLLGYRPEFGRFIVKKFEEVK